MVFFTVYPPFSSSFSFRSTTLRVAPVHHKPPLITSLGMKPFMPHLANRFSFKDKPITYR